MVFLNDDLIYNLIDAAKSASQKAYVPYSHYKVGAALLAKGKNGENIIITGCNVENAAYSPGICAERTAVAKAVSEGYRDFRAIAIVASNDGRDDACVSPCGVCRQVLREFVNPSDFEVIMAKDKTDYKCLSLEELLPYSFGPENLKN